jgi:hypothetical protein
MENTTQTETLSSFSALAHAAAALTLSPVFASIEAAALPVGFVTEKIRDLTQKERTAKIRAALKACGVLMGSVGKGVSVKSATGSMCYWTHVEFARAQHAEGTTFFDHNRMECPVCQVNITADRKLSALVLQAFPDLDDRSDSMTDYSDFVFSVTAV